MTKPQVTIENFTIEAPDWLACRCGCRRFNMMPRFLISLQAFRYSYGRGIIPTSGCRCAKWNADPRVGGVPTSFHECTTKQASAVDVTGADVKGMFEAAKKFALATGLFNEVIYYPKKNIVHLGWGANKSVPYIAIL